MRGCILKVRVPQQVELERALLLTRPFCSKEIKQGRHPQRIMLLVLQDFAQAGMLPWRRLGSPQS